MAITTVDVVTNTVSGNEAIKNATTIVSCTRTGTYNNVNAIFEKSFTYNQIESKYTSRFDDIGFYHSVDGGNP
jgi:hypothetical protein